MDELISIIQFHTAVPFGYGLFLLIWLIITIGSLRKMMILIWRRQYHSSGFYLFSAIFICSIAYLYGTVRYEQNLDMNPVFKDEDIVGRWEYGKAKMILEPSGQAQFSFSKTVSSRVHLHSGNGFWHREGDFNIKIHSLNADQSATYGLFRVIKYHDDYRIIIDDFNDPDMWDGSLGFRKATLSVASLSAGYQ